MGKKRGKKAKQRPPAPSVCRDCGASQTVPRYAYFKAGQPRCQACGGLLDYTGSWHRTRR